MTRIKIMLQQKIKYSHTKKKEYLEGIHYEFCY